MSYRTGTITKNTVAVFEGEVFNNLTIIKEVERIKFGKELRRAVEARCVCGNIITCALNSLRTGNTKSCGCIGKKFITSDNRNIKLREVLSKSSFIFPENIKIQEGTQIIDLTCSKCNQVTSKIFNGIVSKGVQCRVCNIDILAAITEEEKIVKLTKALSKTTLSFHSKVNKDCLNSKDNIYLKCSDCEMIIKRRYSAVIDAKYGCPCKTSTGYKDYLTGTLYLLTLKNKENTIVGYKYGITNNLKERVLKIKSKSKFVPELLMVWEYANGSVARLHEKTFKKLLKPIISKIEMKDGWSETFNKELVSTFLNIQFSQYLNYCEGT